MSSTHLTSEDIERMLADARNGGPAVVPVLPREDRDHWVMLVEMSETTPPPEMHADETDIYFALEGAAQLTLDGELKDPEEKSPGQFIGSEIVGGRTLTIRAGDVVHIPAGVPHQVVTGQTPYKQFVVKIAAE